MSNDNPRGPFQPPPPQAPPPTGQPPYWQAGPPPRKSHKVRNSILVGITVVALIIIVSAGVSGGGKGSSNTPAASGTQAAAQGDTSYADGQPCSANGATSYDSSGDALKCASGTWTMQDAASAPSSPPSSSAPSGPTYTPAQQQALEAALGYLTDGQGFSKAGLISQLTSSYGNGFPPKVADFVVDHLSTPALWRRQAVIAAKGYMSDGEGFSYKGLVQQLDSPYGSQFTYAQAVYAAHKVGL